jgi:replicative DNA helicase
MSEKEALEAAILGQMMIDNSIIPEVQKRIKDEYHWSDQIYEDLWYAITATYDQGATADALNVATILKEGDKYKMNFKAEVEDIARVLEAATHMNHEIMVDALLMQKSCAICSTPVRTASEICQECHRHEKEKER